MSSKKTRANNAHKLRIIGGQWRSRQISFAAAPGLRPTGDRIRETVFNWLAPYIRGAQCLDLFAGSGALGLEALSRGAGSCTALELDSAAAGQLRDNKQTLNAAQLTIVEVDTVQYLQHNSLTQTFDIIFIDPPFDGHLHSEICATLQANNWLAKDAIIYCELPTSDNKFIAPPSWRKLQEKVAGEVKYCLYSPIEPKD